jgi:hypothetical protein
MNRHHIGAFITTSRRYINQPKPPRVITATQTEIKICQAELDSHTDTCGVNDVARILEFTDQVAAVSGFSEGLGTLNDVPIATAAVA